MKKIVRITNIEDEISYLDYADNYHSRNRSVENNPIFTIEEVADFCDLNAEGRNNHAYTGVHRILAALLYKHVPTHTLSIMKEIAESGGLDAMNGLYATGFTGAHDVLGIPDDWSEWSLKEKSQWDKTFTYVLSTIKWIMQFVLDRFISHGIMICLAYSRSTIVRFMNVHLGIYT